MTHNYRARLLASTLLVAALPATAAFAQVTPNPAPSVAAQPAINDAAEEGTIIVTGSRIERPDLQASSPVATLSGEALKLNNSVTVEQLLTANPQFVAGQTSASNNPGDGAATVDLRGLGSNRTLVLLDGKRAPTYDTTGSVDVNTIPTALIKRIDVLTGGASAVYGSDAISGVVNFILDDRFTGLRADLSSQVSGQGDGAQYDASLTGGIALGDRGNIVVSGGYSKRQGVKFGDRPRNSNAVDSSDLVTSAGSSNTTPTAFDTGQGRLQITDSGVLSPNVQLYNFTPVNYVQLPFERYNAMALVRYDITDGVEFYGRANYVHSKVITTLAPTATAGFFFNIDPANPFLTASERAVFFDPATATINDGSDVSTDPTARAGTSQIGIRRRITETGGRIEDHTTKNYQFVGGLRGDLGTSLKWDVFAQYGETKRHEVLKNDLSYTALQQALDVVQGPNGPQCFDPSNGCVPLNLFTTGTIPQSQLAFVLRDALQDTKTTQFVAGANLTGDLGFLQSPFAERPAAFSFGVEYRRETGATKVDANYASGDLIYYGQGQNISGKYTVKEVYGEIKVPLVQNRPFFYSLGLEGGFRYSDYSTVGSVYTYKGGGDWAPVEGVRFRGIYQRAVRAPNIYELYSPVVAGTGSLNNDPCAGTGVTAANAAICIAQGAPANRIGSIPAPISGQINIFSGGNPNLKAEKSDTFTAGVVVNLPSLRAFSFSVDYYNIRIANAIDSTPPSITVNQCYNIDKNAASAACSGIVRNSLDGSLSGPLNVGVPGRLGNIAVIKTSGIDVAASYHGGEQTGFSYGLSVAGTYTASYKKQSDPTQEAIQCAGRFGSGCNLEPIAKWKHVVDLNLGFNGINFSTRWRYFGAVKEDAQTSILVSRIPSFSYFDETASFAVNDKFTFRAGVQNLFDKKSPIVGDTVGADANAGSTFPNTYDVIGRTFFAGISAGF
ncbi:MAG: hypothetical protein JWL66_2357 [Sphingomonadales bacterium]|nr:hypothetical protein [Sphingomonadales bacterium]